LYLGLLILHTMRGEIKIVGFCQKLYAQYAPLTVRTGEIPFVGGRK